MSGSLADSTHLSLAQRLGELHQMLYRRGGIRPSNAAVEELAKLVLLRLAADRHPSVQVDGYGALGELVDPERVRMMSDVQPMKAAFSIANALADFASEVQVNHPQPVWPVDEPLRITRSDVLAEALETLAPIKLGGQGSLDPIGTAFDVFLKGRFEHAGGLGTYLTPDAVVRSMVKVGFDLVGDSTFVPGRLMGDPCCGTGRFLVGMLEEVRSRSDAAEVVGADQSSSAVAMARVNLLAYGLRRPKVMTVHDSIVDDGIDGFRGKLGLILTNPPFGEGKYDSNVGISKAAHLFPGLVRKRRIDPSLAFVARCIELLAPGGVAGIVLPDGVADGSQMRDLFTGPARLIADVRLEGVVSLPSATFAPAGTVAKTSVVFMRKAAPPSRFVFLARSDHVGHVMRKGQIAPDPAGNDLPKIVAEINAVLANPSGPVLAGRQVVTVDAGTMKALDASSLDSTSSDARRELDEAGGRSLREVLSAVKKQRTGLSTEGPFVSVLHVDELGNVDWIKAETYRPTTPGIVAKSGQIIVSLLNPAKFRATVVPKQYDEIQCSAEFGVFESSIDPYAVLALLQHPLTRAQIAPLGRGTSSSRRRIEPRDVIELVVPTVDDDWVDKTARCVSEAMAQVAVARAELIHAYSGD